MTTVKQRACELAIAWSLATCTGPYSEMCGKCQSAVDAIAETLAAERSAALEEAAMVVESKHVNHGDHYGSFYAPSPDAEVLAEAVSSLKEK